MEEEKRDTWSNKIDFLLACIGFSVGLGNVWRFPYLCYKNGGGAFLIPYLICVIIGGIPLFYLEVALGQFMAQGGPFAWRIVPILQGIGLATTVIVFFLNCYYNVILAWAFYYMFASFTSELPWESCDNYWNTDRCATFDEQVVASTNATTMAPMMDLSTAMMGDSNMSDSMNMTTASSMPDIAMNMTDMANMTEAPVPKRVDSVVEFWERKVLNITDGIEDVGEVKWDLCLTLLFAWFVVFACICKGIKTSGKVMYVTATSPYIFMLILLIRMAFLDGAKSGLYFYLVPDFSKMTEAEVWIDAGTQIFFSYSIALGALTALGSYNKWNHNSYRDSIIFACANSGTSIFAGIVIFEVLGFMAKEQGVSVDDVAESGPGLAFIAYPKAVSQMPISPLWAIMFFLMVILLGLDSQFVGVEGLSTACIDTFPALRRGKYRKEIFTGVLCIIQFLVGIPMVTRGGMYVFQLFDYYSGSRILLLVAFFMCVAVGWIYGADRFYDNIEMMYGFRISPFMKTGWMFMSPAFCMAIFIMSTISYSELTYGRPTQDEDYVYPDWAVGIGWGMAAIAASTIPITAVYNYYTYCIRDERPFLDLLKPQGLKRHQLRPQDMHELTENTLDKDDLGQGIATATFENNGYTGPEDGIKVE